ncbi:MAG: hypothetical protein OQK81_03570 [Candidatus Bathyarchaeota archaeon]|nr:hypothetical protein [Candidatus Bathyarchaeota archaeon]
MGDLMRINPVVLLVLVNVFVIGFGGVLAFSDLNTRTYSTLTHSTTRVVSVEYGVLSYRPTYQYYDRGPAQVVVVQGSWTFDFLQFAIFVMAIVDVRWIYVNKQSLN